MLLFDAGERKDEDFASYSEPMFGYLNRSAREPFRRVRVELEHWFSHYPSLGQTDLRRRFRSKDDGAHQGAFFELLVHEALLRLRCRAILHPPVPGSSKHPDFLVHPQVGQDFYLEVTTTTTKSDAEIRAQARINAVYDIVDREVDSSRFFLSIDINGSPRTQPPAKKIARFLNARLAELDPDEVLALMEAGGWGRGPSWPFDLDGWQIEFRPIPKKREARGRPGARPIGAIGTGVQSVDHKTPVRRAVMGKGQKYGELDLPFVLAVNVLEYIDDIDVMQALFGTEQWPILDPDPSTGEPRLGPMHRRPDGAWFGPRGPRYTRISAVLLTRRLSPYNIHEAPVRVFHHPWAEHPIGAGLTRLPQALPAGNRLELVGGQSLGRILCVPRGWPLERPSTLESVLARLRAWTQRWNS